MQKSKLGIFIDSLFSSSIISVILFIWLNKFLKNAFLITFLSILINILLFILFFSFGIKKYKLTKIKFNDKVFANNCFINITLMKGSQLEIFFKKLLNVDAITKHFFINNSSCFYINLYSDCTKQDLVSANNTYLSLKTNMPLIFITTNYTPEFQEFAKNLPYIYYLFYFDDLFNLMKENNIYPISKTEPQKNSFLSHIKLLLSKFTTSFTKSNFKNFFFSGLSLLAISLFIPYSIYYLIIGTSLLVFSILCLLSKNKTFTKQEKQSLDSFIKKDV